MFAALTSRYGSCVCLCVSIAEECKNTTTAFLTNQIRFRFSSISPLICFFFLSHFIRCCGPSANLLSIHEVYDIQNGHGQVILSQTKKKKKIRESMKMKNASKYAYPPEIKREKCKRVHMNCFLIFAEFILF